MKPFLEISAKIRRIGEIASICFAGKDANRLVMRTFARWFAENRKPLSVSIAVAVAIYCGIHERAPIEEFERTVGVVARNVPQSVTLGISPPIVKVKFRGSREDRNSIDYMDPPPVVVVNYPAGRDAGGPGGEVRVRINPRNIDLPGVRGFGAVRAIRVEPAFVVLNPEPEVTRTIQVDKPKCIGVPDRGVITDISIAPDAVEVCGAASTLDRWESFQKRLRLADIPVAGRHESFSFVSKVLPPPGEEWQSARPLTNSVSVLVSIEPSRRRISYENIPVRMAVKPGAEIAGGAKIVPEEVTVVLSGDKKVVEGIGKGEISVIADASAVDTLSTNVHLLDLTVYVPTQSAVYEVTATPPRVMLLTKAPPGEEDLEAPVPPKAEEENANAASLPATNLLGQIAGGEPLADSSAEEAPAEESAIPESRPDEANAPAADHSPEEPSPEETDIEKAPMPATPPLDGTMPADAQPAKDGEAQELAPKAKEEENE